MGAAIALGLHAAIAAGVLTLNPSRFRAETPIEIDVEEKQPPPPEVKPAPEPPPPPERPRVAVRRAPAPAQPPPPPPPPRETPPKPSDAPPVFGVSLDSTVAGDGPGMAVPVGNTLMTKPGKAAHVGDTKTTEGSDSHPFTPVAEMYIRDMPVVIHEVKGDDIYPAEAKRMGIEGVVRLKIGIDEKGNVVEVRLQDRAGHGFDEAAAKAMRQFKFSPAIANDGRPVPFRIVWTFRFDLMQ
jgi:protein TonB